MAAIWWIVCWKGLPDIPLKLNANSDYRVIGDWSQSTFEMLCHFVVFCQVNSIKIQGAKLCLFQF
jgi:hypothetical protein